MGMTNHIPSNTQRMFVHRHRALATSIDVIPPQIAKRELACSTGNRTAAQFVLAFLATHAAHCHINHGPGMLIQFRNDEVREQGFIIRTSQNLFTGKEVVPICLPDALDSGMAAWTSTIMEAEHGMAVWAELNAFGPWYPSSGRLSLFITRHTVIVQDVVKKGEVAERQNSHAADGRSTYMCGEWT